MHPGASLHGPGAVLGIPRRCLAEAARPNGRQATQGEDPSEREDRHEWVEVGRAGTHLRDRECMILVCATADHLTEGQGLMREVDQPEPASAASD